MNSLSSLSAAREIEGDSDCYEVESDCPTSGQEVFDFCDLEGKGYITCKDLQKLKDEISLTDAQLEEVFNTLDENRDGRLELEEFVEGFGMFLAIVANHSERKHLKRLPNRKALSPIRELVTDPYEEFLEHFGLKTQFKNDELLCAMWKHVTEKGSAMLPEFENFLTKVASEMENAKIDCDDLQVILRSRSNENEEHLRQLYESIEKKIASEKAQFLAEENAKLTRIRQQLEVQVRQKDALLVEIRNQHDLMKDKVFQLKAEESARRNQNAQLQKERNELERKLRTAENLRLDIEKEYRALSDLAIQAKRRCEKNENKFLLDTKDALNPYDSHRAGENSIGKIPGRELLISTESSFDMDEINRRGSSLYDYLHDEQSFLENEDCFEAAFEESFKFHRGTNFEAELCPSAEAVNTDHDVSEINAKVTWKVTCKMLVNNVCGLQTHWKVKMKYIPTYQRIIINPVLNCKNAELKSLSEREENHILPLCHQEPIFKVIFNGDSGVGKTSFIQRFCDNTFRSTFQSTIGIDFQEKEITVNGQRTLFQLWDTAGQERFRSMCKQYFRKVDAVIVMYDVTNEQSFRSVRSWMNSIKECAEEDAVILLIGNKTDMRGRLIQSVVGSQLAKEYGATFFETSVKYGTNVEDAMVTLATLLHLKQNQDKEESLQLKDLSDKDSKKRRWC